MSLNIATEEADELKSLDMTTDWALLALEKAVFSIDCATFLLMLREIEKDVAPQDYATYLHYMSDHLLLPHLHTTRCIS